MYLFKFVSFFRVAQSNKGVTEGERYAGYFIRLLNLENRKKSGQKGTYLQSQRIIN